MTNGALTPNTKHFVIGANRGRFVSQAAKPVAQMLKQNSQRPLTAAEADAIGHRVGEWYVSSVQQFLHTHRGARPKQGTRNALAQYLGAQDEFNRPWCDDWATYLLDSAWDLLSRSKVRVGGSEIAVGDVVRMERVQWQGWVRQHNYVLVRPHGHKVADPPSSDPVVVMYDPWIKILPEVYTAKNHPYPAMNTGIK